MHNTIEIKHLNREEKIKVMEALWVDLSIESEQIESPEWHNEVLKETNNRFNNGLETIISWQEAKKELRKRFE